MIAQGGRLVANFTQQITRSVQLGDNRQPLEGLTNASTFSANLWTF